MRTVDLIVTIAVRLTLLGLAGGLIYSGVTGLSADRMMFEVLGKGQMAAMLPFFAIHLAMFAAGSGIAAFALFGLVKAVRTWRAAGPATLRRGPVEPMTARRIFSALAFGCGMAFGIVTLAPAVLPMLEIATLHVVGIPATATITAIAQLPDDSFIVQYRFNTLTGEATNGEQPLGWLVGDRVQHSPTLDILYLPDNPSHSDLADPGGLQSAGFFLVTRLGLILVGIWGVWKALRRSHGEGPEALTGAESMLPIESLQALPSSAVTSGLSPVSVRRSFGRRGV